MHLVHRQHQPTSSEMLATASKPMYAKKAVADPESIPLMP